MLASESLNPVWSDSERGWREAGLSDHSGMIAVFEPMPAMTELPPGPQAAPRPSTPPVSSRGRSRRCSPGTRAYGDVFTVALPRSSAPASTSPIRTPIRELFTGDQSDLRAGEANSFLEPVLGPHSVLVLDGPEHLRQRKLLLPPFQGSRGGRASAR